MSPSTSGVASDSAEQGARVPRLPPPFFYVAAYVVGKVLDRVTRSRPTGGRRVTTVIGVVTLAAGAGLTLVGGAEVIRHNTTVVPHHPVSAVVTTGPYLLSRNPMYTGMALGYLGATLLTGARWPLATLPVAVVALQRLVIEPEERYLTGKFGSVYADYQARVRRWL